MASKITTIVANFETQLASTISAGGVTGSLKSPVIDDDGVILPNAKYVMCVDLGSSKEEHLIFDLVGTTGEMTNIKSVSRQGVETTGAVRQHRTGAKVTLTNFANLLYISKLLQGQVALDGGNPLIYDVAPTFSNALQIATKGYVDATLSGTVGTAGEILNGTTRLSRDQGAKQKAKVVWAREQDTPDKTLKVEAIKLAFIDKIIDYAGGNTPNFIDPAMGGDLGVALQPANGETITVTVDGVATVLTFVTTIGVTAGNILIGASATTARANLVAFLNNPSVTSATQVAVTGTNLTAIQKLSATDDLSLNAFIRVTNPATTSFSVSETMAGAGNIWTVNSTKNRYDLVVIDNAGTLQIRRGAEAVSPVVPTPTTGDAVICSVLNRVGQTTVRDYNLAGQAYITDWYDLSVYRTDIITALPAQAFSGDGSDGALIVSSGVTNIDLGGLAVVTKNYTSIAITGTGQVTFSNPHANGTIIRLKSQGNVDLTSSTIPNLDASGMGALGGTGSVQAHTTPNAGGTGNTGNGVLDTLGTHGGAGQTAGTILTANSLYSISDVSAISRGILTLVCGSGGGGGSGGADGNGAFNNGGNGGRGGGALQINCGGALNFTSTLGVSVAGKNGSNGVSKTGSNGASGTGGGGGGAGGTCYIFYTTLTSASGTINSAGGAGGIGGDCTDQAGGGGGVTILGGAGGGGAGSLGGAGGTGGAPSSNANGNAGAGAGGPRAGGGGGSGAATEHNTTTTRTGGGSGAGGASENLIVTKNYYF